MELLYRDGLEVFQFLYGNPVFANHQKHAPERLWADYKKEMRIYDEPMTGDYVWKVQVR